MPIRKDPFEVLETVLKVALLVLVIAAPCNMQGFVEHKRVLILFQGERTLEAQQIVENSLRSALENKSQVPVEIYAEYLDSARTEITSYEPELVNLLKKRYADKHFDLIFAVTHTPLQLLLRHRTELFPDTPVVYLTHDRRNIADLDIPPDMTGVWGEISFKENLDQALVLHPGTKNVVVVSGVSDWDKYWLAKAQEDFRSYEPALRFDYLVGHTSAELKTELAQLPAHTVVVFITNVLDNAGNTYENIDVLRTIAPTSSAPIYGTTDAQLGNGIVGGKILSFETLGDEAATVGLRILNGEKPEAIAPHPIPNRPMFDWRQLQRWGISESSLPEGSIVRFKQPSIWSQYRWYIFGSVGLLSVETFLLGLLVYLRLRRRQAEAEADRLGGRIKDIVANVPGIVWETRTDPLTGRRKTTFISDYVQELLGYGPEEWLKEPPGFGLRLVHEDDRERVERESDAVTATGEAGMSEFRWHRRDGIIRWVRNYLVPIVGRGGTVDGLRGVALDVTEEKLAEEKARQAEEKDKAILAAIPDLMFLQTLDGVYLDYHATEPSDLFVPPEQFLGKNVKDILPPDLAQRFLTCFSIAEDGGKPLVLEYKLEIAGRDRWFEARMVRRGDKILSIVRDISERMRALEALLRSEERFGKAFRANPQPMTISTLSGGRYVEVNRAFLDLSGYSREEVIGRTSIELGIWDSAETRGAFVDELVTTGYMVNREIRFHTKDGNVRTVLASAERLTFSGEECLLIASNDITERHAAQQALQESEARLRLAYQASRMGTFERNVQTGKNVWSAELEAMYGLEPGTYRGTQSAWEELIHPDDREIALELNARAFETKEPVEGEWRVVWPDGSVHWIYCRAQVVSDKFGNPFKFSGINIDITNRKLADEALRNSEEFNRTILASLSSHVCVLDRAGTIISANAAWLNFAIENGIESTRSVGPGINYLNICQRSADLGDDSAKLALDGVREVLSGRKESFTIEYPCHSPEEKRWFLMSVTQLMREEGGAVVVHSDITERKEAIAAVVESEKRFRNMADTAPVLIWVSDSSGKCIYVNKEWLNLTGRDFDSQLGYGWSECVHPTDLPDCRAIIDASIIRRQPFELEYRVRRYDGQYRWIVDRGTPRFSSSGEFVGYIGSCIDITERKESEQALANANVELKELKNKLEAENIYLHQELQQDRAFGDIVGQSAAIKYVLFKVSQVAPTNATVLISGETGTGKELVARAIHEASPRKDQPLIRVNCAALSPTLIESELFGHEKGSFTGAVGRKIGRFELANHGTLMLDEIGELPLDLQAKLLRVLQEGEFERVGSGNTIKADVRVIALTNRDLKQEVERGKFREDLWYRLNVFPITTPPLRDRREDIPILAEHFATLLSRRFGREITAVSSDTMSKLNGYSWPGNVRELANIIERAVINSEGPVLRIREDLSLRQAEISMSSSKTLEEIEKEHITAVLEGLHWRIDGPRGGARVLGINPSTLRTRMAKLGIRKPNGKEPQ